MSKNAKIQVRHYSKTGKLVNVVKLSVIDEGDNIAVVLNTFKKHYKQSRDLYVESGHMKKTEHLIPTMNTNIMVFIDGKLSPFKLRLG